MLEAVGRQSDVLGANTMLGFVGSLHTSSLKCRIALGMARTGMNDECLRPGRDSPIPCHSADTTRDGDAHPLVYVVPAWPHDCKSAF